MSTPTRPTPDRRGRDSDHTLLTLAEASRMIAQAVRDRSYADSPVGKVVAAYIRYLRNEWGATPSTVRDYEAVLARMAITLSDRELAGIAIDDLRSVIDLWADRHPRTRAKVTSVIRSFWKWAEDEGLIDISPAARLRRPRAPKPAVPLLPARLDAQLLGAVTTPRDRVAVLCLLDLGIRRNELRGLRVRSFDLARRTVVVFGKGQKERVIPLRGRIVLEFEAYLLTDLPKIGRVPDPDDYLIYPRNEDPAAVSSSDTRAGNSRRQRRIAGGIDNSPSQARSNRASHEA